MYEEGTIADSSRILFIRPEVTVTTMLHRSYSGRLSSSRTAYFVHQWSSKSKNRGAIDFDGNNQLNIGALESGGFASINRRSSSREPDLDLIGAYSSLHVSSKNPLLGHDTFTEMLRGTILVFAALLVLASATEVYKCGTGEKFEDSNQVKITGCDAPPCKLKRRTRPSVEEKFIADRDTQNVMTSVNAAVLGVPLPFVGVDGTSACENIFNLDGTAAGCTLKKGVEYIYKKDFPVLQIYPTISMVIHYSLVEGNETIACFEVPAKITN